MEELNALVKATFIPGVRGFLKIKFHRK